MLRRYCRSRIWRQLYRHMTICRANMFGRGFGGTCTNIVTVHANAFAFACYEKQAFLHCSFLFSCSTTETRKHEQTVLSRLEIPIVAYMYTGIYFPWSFHDWSSGTGHSHPRLLHASSLTCTPHSNFWLAVFCISARLWCTSEQYLRLLNASVFGTTAFCFRALQRSTQARANISFTV